MVQVLVDVILSALLIGQVASLFLVDALSFSPRLDLWPGFIASILQYEDNVMLCADVSHKIMRADTVYDFMDDLFRQYGNDPKFHDTAIKSLVGEIVLTRSGPSCCIFCCRLIPRATYHSTIQ